MEASIASIAKRLLLSEHVQQVRALEVEIVWLGATRMFVSDIQMVCVRVACV